MARKSCGGRKGKGFGDNKQLGYKSFDGKLAKYFSDKKKGGRTITQAPLGAGITAYGGAYGGGAYGGAYGGTTKHGGAAYGGKLKRGGFFGSILGRVLGSVGKAVTGKIARKVASSALTGLASQVAMTGVDLAARKMFHKKKWYNGQPEEQPQQQPQ